MGLGTVNDTRWERGVITGKEKVPLVFTEGPVNSWFSLRSVVCVYLIARERSLSRS